MSEEAARGMIKHTTFEQFRLGTKTEISRFRPIRANPTISNLEIAIKEANKFELEEKAENPRHKIRNSGEINKYCSHCQTQTHFTQDC